MTVAAMKALNSAVKECSMANRDKPGREAKKPKKDKAPPKK